MSIGEQIRMLAAYDEMVVHASRMEAERDRYREALEEIWSHDPVTCPGVGPKDCFDKVTEIARAALATEAKEEA